MHGITCISNKRSCCVMSSVCMAKACCRVWLKTSSHCPRTRGRESAKTKVDWIELKRVWGNGNTSPKLLGEKVNFPIFDRGCQIRCFKSAYWIIRAPTFPGTALRFEVKRWDFSFWHFPIDVFGNFPCTWLTVRWGGRNAWHWNDQIAEWDKMTKKAVLQIILMKPNHSVSDSAPHCCS